MIRHEWRERTSEGEVRFVRADKHGGIWQLQARLKSEETWTRLDPPPVEDLHQLRDVLWRKYQRRRASIEDVRQVEDLIANR